MRPIFSIALLALIGCSPEQLALNEQVQLEGNLPEDVDQAAMTEDFLASGAQFGVVVDPASGDTVTLTNLDRASISGDFTAAGPAVCVDCGNPTCGAPTFFSRQVQFPLTRTTGAGPVDITYVSPTNWNPAAENCAGSACPTSIATGSTFNVDLFGAMNTCSAFSVYFDADDGAVVGTPRSATINPAVAITDNNTVCADIPINAGADVVQGDMQLDVSINHTWVGDLDIRIIAPGSTSITVMNRPGRTTSGFGFSTNLVASSPFSFADTGTTDAETLGSAGVACQDDGRCDYFPNPDQVTSPVTFAAAFNGVAATGTWQICIVDQATGDSGSLQSATLSFLSAP